MKPLATLMLLFLSSLSFAQTAGISWQFAVVQDKDGYCNVRSSEEMGNNISDKLTNGQFVFVYEKRGNWMSVAYTKNNKEESGFIYHDRLKMVAGYQDIPEASNEENTLGFSGSNIKVTITRQAFNKSKHRLAYYNNDPKTHIVQIDGKEFWGTDGDMPASEYKSIIVTIGAKKVTLPKAALEGLFQPSLNRTEVHYDKEKDIVYITAGNSDGAGSYNVIWKIEKSVYKGRYVNHMC